MWRGGNLLIDYYAVIQFNCKYLAVTCLSWQLQLVTLNLNVKVYLLNCNVTEGRQEHHTITQLVFI